MKPIGRHGKNEAHAAVLAACTNYTQKDSARPVQMTTSHLDFEMKTAPLEGRYLYTEFINIYVDSK
jgi:hypothetical protein